MSIKQELLTWADSHKGSQSDLARKIASDLDSEKSRSVWSLIDIRREFEQRESADPLRVKVLGALATFSYLVPVVVAWLHLKDAFDQYQSAIRQLPKGETINFLGFWSGGYEGRPWGFRGTTASQAALHILLSFLLILLFHALSTAAESRVDKADPVLDDLILKLSLEVGRSRAITPEEMAGSLKVVSEELRQGLQNLTSAIAETEIIMNRVSGVANAIGESASLIERATQGLGDAMQPLQEFGDIARAAGNALENATRTLDVAGINFRESIDTSAATLHQGQDAFSSAIKQSIDAARSVGRTSENLGLIVESAGTVAREAEETVDQIMRVGAGMKKTQELFDQLVSQISRANDQINEVAKTSTSPDIQTYLVVVQDCAQTMAQSAAELTRAVEHVSKQLNEWNGSANYE
jgi:ABC-type transporter Mla subunit MlaD